MPVLARTAGADHVLSDKVKAFMPTLKAVLDRWSGNPVRLTYKNVLTAENFPIPGGDHATLTFEVWEDSWDKNAVINVRDTDGRGIFVMGGTDPKRPWDERQAKAAMEFILRQLEAQAKRKPLKN